MPGLENLKQIPNGVRGTRETIKEMARLVNAGKKKYKIICIATDIVRNVPERDKVGEVRAIFNWVKNNIRFTEDVYDVETISDPLYTISRGAGDCDDLSILMNSLCAAIGFDTKFKTIKANKKNPNQFSHVYSLIKVNGKWIPADPSQNVSLGWEPPSHYGYKVWGYSGGYLKGKNMGNLGSVQSRLSIKQRISNLISGKKQKKQVAKKKQPQVSPERQNTIEIQKIKQEPLGPVEPVIVPVDEGIEPYNQNEWGYYGDDEDDDPGTYQYTDYELEIDTGHAIEAKYPVRSNEQALRERQRVNNIIHSMPRKFRGRQYFDPERMNYEGKGLKHSSPAIEPMQSPFGTYGSAAGKQVMERQ